MSINLQNAVRILEEDTPTGGHYQAKCFSADVPASIGWHDLADVSFPFPIGLLSAASIIRSACDLDEIAFVVSPDTVIGTLTQDAGLGDDVLNVSDTVCENTRVGALIKLDDGVNPDACGRVLAIDQVTGQITVETPTDFAFSAATPTYVKQTIEMLSCMELIAGARIELGSTKIGASHIPANTVLRMKYNNKTGNAGKRFSFILEYLY
jgi:hypothetical protein